MSDATRGASGGISRPQTTGGTSSGQQLVITDPNRLVPVQITIPAQPNNPTSQPRALTVQVKTIYFPSLPIYLS